jgi:hypothetical protein
MFKAPMNVFTVRAQISMEKHKNIKKECIMTPPEVSNSIIMNSKGSKVDEISKN